MQYKRNQTLDFDTNEILYHGTNEEFEIFDRSKARTAAHIYTTPDFETAEGYGTNIYAVYGRQEPQAVLTPENCNYQLVRKIHRKGCLKRIWNLSYNELLEYITDGRLYNYDYKGRLQDDVIDACISLGYKNVRITDAKSGGGYSDSVIFGDPNDLQIIEKVE